jgi:AhpD family alkylhydroperoxidase
MKETPRGFKMNEASNEPQEVNEVFNWYKENFGFVPNLIKVLSASPAALRSYWLTQLQLQQYGLLTPEEHNVVQMSIAVENRCKYCTAGHNMIGKGVFGSEEEDLQALRNETSLSTEKFDALRSFTIEVYRNQGRVSEAVLEAFLSQGYNKAQAVEVVANISVKVLSILANQLALTDLDEPLVSFAEGLFEE